MVRTAVIIWAMCLDYKTDKLRIGMSLTFWMDLLRPLNEVKLAWYSCFSPTVRRLSDFLNRLSFSIFLISACRILSSWNLFVVLMYFGQSQTNFLYNTKWEPMRNLFKNRECSFSKFNSNYNACHYLIGNGLNLKEGIRHKVSAWTQVGRQHHTSQCAQVYAC